MAEFALSVLAFIGSYWWAWLVGLIVCGAFGAYKWITNVFSAGTTFFKVANLTLQGMQSAKTLVDKETDTSQKIGELQNQLETHIKENAIPEIKSRAIGFITAFVVIFCANVFGVLLFLSIIVNLIDYYKS